ncbi:putative phage related protein [Escherichia coli]|nr:putative phage related protein [Escherichia coli]
MDIAQAIRGNKGQGTATHGTTSVTVPDKYGNPHVIKFSRSSDVPVYARIKLKVFTGYTCKRRLSTVWQILKFLRE